MSSRNSLSESEEVWKERLAFTSGAIIVWGLLLLQLWPFVKRFQLGETPIDLTLLYYQGDEPPEYFAFLYMLILISLGVWIVLLAVAHILSRGLWLIHGEAKSNYLMSQFKGILSFVAYESYVGVFVLSAIIIIWLVFGATISIVNFCLMALFVNSLNIARWISEWLAGLGSVVLIIFLLFIFVPRVVGAFSKSIVESDSEEIKEKRLKLIRKQLNALAFGSTRVEKILRFLTFFFFVVTVFIIGQAAATVNLRLSKKIFYLSQDKAIEVFVELGGSTGSPSAASLKLLNFKQESQDLALRNLGDGQYASYVLAKDLKPGPYEVKISYKHTTLNFSPPFLHLETTKSERFLVDE